MKDASIFCYRVDVRFYRVLGRSGPRLGQLASSRVGSGSVALDFVRCQLRSGIWRPFSRTRPSCRTRSTCKTRPTCKTPYMMNPFPLLNDWKTRKIDSTFNTFTYRALLIELNHIKAVLQHFPRGNWLWLQWFSRAWMWLTGTDVFRGCT